MVCVLYGKWYVIFMFQVGGKNNDNGKPEATKQMIAPMVVSCVKCGFTSGHRSSLTRHMISKHGNTGTSKRPTHKCDICQKWFTTKQSLSIHIDGVHDLRFQCHQCGKHYASRSGLIEHEAKHDDKKKYACPESGCNATFGRMTQMQGHINHVHRHHVPYECANDKCQRKFAHKQSCLQHQRHCGISASIECGFEGCKREFATISARKEHRIARHSEVKRCSCGKSYNWRPSLARHKKVTGHL